MTTLVLIRAACMFLDFRSSASYISITHSHESRNWRYCIESFQWEEKCLNLIEAATAYEGGVRQCMNEK